MRHFFCVLGLAKFNPINIVTIDTIRDGLTAVKLTVPKFCTINEPLLPLEHSQNYSQRYSEENVERILQIGERSSALKVVLLQRIILLLDGGSHCICTYMFQVPWSGCKFPSLILQQYASYSSFFHFSGKEINRKQFQNQHYKPFFLQLPCSS